mgnify:FL=1
MTPGVRCRWGEKISRCARNDREGRCFRSRWCSSGLGVQERRAGGWSWRRWYSRGVREKARESHDCQGMGNRRLRGVPWRAQRAPYTRQGIGFRKSVSVMPRGAPQPRRGIGCSRCNKQRREKCPPPAGALRRIITLVPTRERAPHARRGIGPLANLSHSRTVPPSPAGEWLLPRKDAASCLDPGRHCP